MNPEPRPESWFGRTVNQAVRGATILSLLGCGAIISLQRYLVRPNTPIGEAFHAAKIPPQLPLVLGIGCVIAIAMGATWTSIRTAPRFRITEEGLDVRSALGSYRFDWDNVHEVGVTSTGALGLRIEDRDALVATHQGTAQQREWLRTTEPYGEWDFLFQRAELGHRAAYVLEWIREVCGDTEGDAETKK
jgi:hypothetical protein